MKRIFNIENMTMLAICLFVPLLLTSCDKDNFPPDKKYFDSKINGNVYEATSSLIPSIYGDLPRSGYVENNNLHYFHFYSDCYPKDKNKSDDAFALYFTLYLEESLKTGEKYIVQAIPDLDYMTSKQTEKEYQDKKVSYCLIKYALTYENYCFGKGFVEFSRIDFEKNRVEGKLEFEIPFPNKDGNRTTLNVVGSFRSNLRDS